MALSGRIHLDETVDAPPEAVLRDADEHGRAVPLADITETATGRCAAAVTRIGNRC